MREVYLVRHGKSNDNIQRPPVIGGRRYKVPLCDEGRVEAGLIAARFVREGFYPDAFYTSPALRTKDTASAIASALGFPWEKVVVSDQLAEISRGEWEGRLREEYYTRDLIERLHASPEESLHFKAPGGESFFELAQRSHDWLEKQNGRVLGVTHERFITSVLWNVLKFDPRAAYDLNLSNTGITHLRYSKRWRVVRVNDDAHLRSRRVQL